MVDEEEPPVLVEPSLLLVDPSAVLVDSSSSVVDASPAPEVESVAVVTGVASVGTHPDTTAAAIPTTAHGCPPCVIDHWRTTEAVFGPGAVSGRARVSGESIAIVRAMVLRLRRVLAFLSMVSMGPLAGCFTAEDPPAGCEEGAEGCPCFANQTCLTGLMCQDQTCVGEEASSGATMTSATTTTGMTESTTATTTTAGVTTDTPTSTTAATESTTAATVTTTDPTGDESTSSSTSTGDTDGVLACDPMNADCPGGEKCNPWSDDGSADWNAFGCFPLDPAPVDPGEPCAIEDAPYSGIDNCGPNAVCVPEVEGGLGGVCRSLCSPDGGTCTEVEDSCYEASNGFLGLCVASCDPLLQDCPQNNGCYLSADGNDAACLPDASGAGGAQGSACGDVDECDPGLSCITAAAFGAGCASEACCSEVCDPGSPACPGGLQCTNVGFPNTGVCAEG